MFANGKPNTFDWAAAIARNRDALAGIVVTLFAMLEPKIGGSAERISRPLHRAVLRILRPAGSALRRLIAIAARGLVLKPKTRRARPFAPIVKKSGAARLPLFRLFDPRKRFALAPRRQTSPAKNPPRVWSVGGDAGSAFSEDPFEGVFARDPRVAALAMFQPRPPEPPPPRDRSEIDAGRLGRRLLALKLALADIPKQARRLVRQQERRKEIQKTRPTFTSPIRPGRAPGHRQKPEHEVDRVLAECHWLAFDAMKPDTS
jgi:hypothetical protein